MGLTLQFALGTKDAILDAVRDDDFDYLYRLEEAGLLADFSLHLVPRDLDSLVQAASATSAIKADSLRVHLLFNDDG